MFRAILSGSLGGRSVRTAALIVAQVLSLGLGAAGAIVWQSESAPSWLPQVFAAQEPATLPNAVDCSDPAALSVADIAERVNPAVVTVTNLVEGFGNDEDDAFAVGSGSGFIIDEAGHVITNSHVVAQSEELAVEFEDGTTVPATIVGQDELLDVAVIQLGLSGGEELPGIATLGDSSTVRPGDRVVAIGSALGEFTNTVTEGTVNAIGRSLGGGYGLDNLIQHDAEIWRGNSGGPLLNLRGEVIGVNAAGISNERGADVAPARIAFAIASNAVRAVADELIATGTVARPFLGITGGEIDGGHEVISVAPETPAAESGLQAGDVIVAINGEAITGRVSLLELLLQHEPGETVTLTIERDGAEQEFTIVLGTRPQVTE